MSALDGNAPLHTVSHSEWPAERIAAERQRTVSLCLPARNEAATIGTILGRLMPLLDRGVVDQVVVADDSTDATAAIARCHGAQVVCQSELMTEFGPVLGKGDAMWRSLSVLTGDVVCFLDADSEDLGEHFACGLVGPLACGDEDETPSFAKASYRRPFKSRDGAVQPSGGGRVTELCARPLLRRFFPELAHFAQPLAGEVAARRDLLLQVGMLCGYSVDVALLIDAWGLVGLDGCVQVDLECRQNRHRPLEELGPMADAVVAGVLSRLADPAMTDAADPDATDRVVERPPMSWLAAASPA